MQQTADWLTESMGRMENVSDEALQRGINTVQQGLREGRGVDYIANKLADEMEIPFRRARNVARNEIGNQAWNLEEANARIAGMSIYRWRGMLDERERKEHVGREGKAYTPTRPPRDGIRVNLTVAAVFLNGCSLRRMWKKRRKKLQQETQVNVDAIKQWE